VPSDVISSLAPGLRDTTLFFLVIELVGAALAAVFRISLPVVQVRRLCFGGDGGELLHESDSTPLTRGVTQVDGFRSLESKIFYPFIFR